MQKHRVRVGLVIAMIPTILVVSLSFARPPEVKIGNVTYKDKADFVGQGRRCGTRPVGVAEHRALATRAARFRMANSDVLREHTGPLNIPVFFHVLHKGTQGKVTEARLDKQLDVMNKAFAPHGLKFTKDGVEYTDNAAWFTMDLGTPEELAAKSALQVEPRRKLNFYVAEPPGGTLGWASFPWELAATPALDGVVIQHSSLPDGDAVPYNLGMTAVHEVGHWVGLFHVFGENPFDPCEDTDEVDDTPACKRIFSTPPNGTDTCPDKPGNDPVHNYMAYTDDSHLTEFTPGQKSRMDAQIALYRPLLFPSVLRIKLK